LYADQVGMAVDDCHGQPGVRWVRLVTDVPTAVVELARGRLSWRSYLRSLLSADVEAVFSARDPLPGIVELGLLPYLAVRRGF
jgi:predicted ATP-grasp superfamily ATP-dependent carboligase